LPSQFRKNFEYDYWANDQVLNALAEMAQPPEKGVRTFGHILFALEIWLARLKKEGLSRFTDPNQSYTLLECRQKLDSLHSQWAEYLTALKPEVLEEKVVFPNTQGERYEQLVRNILVHVGYHSHYHRGQLATLVHQGGGKRPNTDYIRYVFVLGEGKKL
jgi:uncharacterized damage-inducible protein DinB